ncbi:MAG: RAMP superfamily CRISPR-associated protein [Methanosarcinales archaeon]
MSILKIKITLKNDFHTTGDTKGSIIDYLKDKHQNPYLPATQIKGVMRTEAERIIRSIEHIDCYITGSKKNNGSIKVCKEVENGRYGCEVCRIFGVPKVEGGNGYREGKIRITDFKTNNKINPLIRTHTSIDRSKQSNIEGALYSSLVVPKNTEFTGYIIIKETLTASECQLLKASLQSLAHYGIGKERSRGLGGVEIELNTNPISYEEFIKEVE